MQRLNLYFAPGSCSILAMAALEEAGASYDKSPVLLAKGDQRSPQFLAISPRGQVPVLQVDREYICENIAIVTYIARQFPEAKLLPAEPLRLAQAYQVMSWFATNLHVAVAQIWRGERFTKDEDLKGELSASGIEVFKRALGAFEELAARASPWLLGESFTAVDVLALVASRWAKKLNIDTAEYPAFDRLASQVEARPSVAQALALEGEALQVNA